MTTLSATAQTLPIPIDAWGTITVSSGGGVGTIQFNSDAPKLLDSFTENLQSKIYGPFGVPGTVTLSITSGTIDYTVTLAAGSGASVAAQIDPVTGGVGIVANGKQVGGTASPYAFTSRVLVETDNGQTRVCASAQVATVNAGMPVGFGVAFKGPISCTAGSGVTITDVRTSGAANPWCALTQTGVDIYDVVGGKT